MRIVIFGGGGFIGSAIVDKLLLGGYEVIVFERKGVKPYRKFSSTEKITWIQGDYLDKNDIEKAIVNADVIFHLISTTLPHSSNDNAAYDVETNVIGTLQLLDAMVSKNIHKIVFISSGGTVYGQPQYIPIDEKHPTEPLVSYGVTKLTIEKYLSIYEKKHGIVALSLRVANPYGERQRIDSAQGALTIFTHLALQNKIIEIWGDGSVTRDFLHVDDVADAFIKAISYSGEFRVFNISSGVGVSLNDIVGELSHILGRHILVSYKNARGFDVPVSILANDLAQSELGWEPKVDIKTGMLRTISWLRRS